MGKMVNSLLFAFALAGPLFAAESFLSNETGHRSCYYKNGEIHVNILGTPEGKPLTTGYSDFKPSWSKTDDMLVFFVG